MKQLLKKLINANSTLQNGELNTANIISDYFEHSGIPSDIDCWDQNRANIAVHIKSAYSKPALLFLCHLDVIEPGEEQWKYPPFEATEENGKIYGRGSADMKAGIAAVATAICQIVASKTRLKGNLIFLATAGEETNNCGVKRFLKNHDNISNLKAVIVPEPTDLDVVTAHNGAFWLHVTTTGKTAHGSAPHLGVNAISSMKILLDELELFKKQRLAKGCSLSVNTIAGGKTINTIPDECIIGIDIRTTIDQNHQAIIDNLEQVFAKIKHKHPSFNAQVKIVQNIPALQTNGQSEPVKQFLCSVGASQTKSVGFCTDGAFFAQLNIPVIIFGPGKPEVCHKTNEYVEITDCERAVEYYKDIILKFLT